MHAVLHLHVVSNKYLVSSQTAHPNVQPSVPNANSESFHFSNEVNPFPHLRLEIRSRLQAPSLPPSLATHAKMLQILVP